MGRLVLADPAASAWTVDVVLNPDCRLYEVERDAPRTARRAGVLAAVIDDYPTPDSPDEEVSRFEEARFDEASHDARVLHAFGVIVDHVALARLAVVDLEQNPAYRPGGVSDIVIPDAEPAGPQQPE